MREPRGHWRPRRCSTLAILAAVGLSIALSNGAPPAAAQSWWPFGGDDEEAAQPPVPRENVYRQPQPVPAPIPQQTPGATNWSTKNPICLQLEQRLVQEGQKGSQTAQLLPKIEAEIREVDRAYNVGASQLNRGCYEEFLFTRTFRNTRQCKELAKQVEISKRRLAELDAQRQGLSSGRSYQDDIIRELARNNCGANYVDQARRRDGGFGGFWTDEEAIGSNNWTPFGGGNGVETFKTVCVRLCDGYYFPVSFSTLPSHFPQDAEVCSSKCAAPTELYYHRNPGGAMEEAVALQSNEPYTRLKTAFRYRKEYVNGCSCKTAEYVPATGEEQKAGNASGVPGQDSDGNAPTRRAAAPAAAAAGSDLTTGSTAPAPQAAPTDEWQTQATPAP